jgi:hypothetical protein
MGSFVRLVVLVAMLSTSFVPALAESKSDLLIIVAETAGAKGVAKLTGRRAQRVIHLPAEIINLAGQLKAEIENGNIAEDGPNAPAHLAAFSEGVLAAIPDLFEYHSIRVVSEQILPLEMVRRDGTFLGDVAEVAHEFGKAKESSFGARRDSRKLPMSRYVLEAVDASEGPRIEQDIVKVALELEREIPVELDFAAGPANLIRALRRGDVSILHIDTHGARGGLSIQVSRDGAMLHADLITAPVRVPVVLLFGCEGVSSPQAFGAVLHAKGADAVISSFATFRSNGLTGNAKREHRIYEGFFSSLRAGQTIGTGLLSLRQAAFREARESSKGPTLTRLFFVLVGRDDIAFAWPSLSEN